MRSAPGRPVNTPWSSGALTSAASASLRAKLLAEAHAAQAAPDGQLASSPWVADFALSFRAAAEFS